MPDSALLQDELNKIGKNLADIGKIHFDKTELELIRTQAGDVAAIRASVTGGGKKENTKNLEDALISETAPDSTIGAIIQDYYGMSYNAVNSNLQRLSEAEFKTGDANNQELASIYNKKINTKLAALKGTSISDEVRDLVFDLQKEHSNAINGGEAGKKVGIGEYNSILTIMNRLIEALDRNTQSTDGNTDSDKDVIVYS